MQSFGGFSIYGRWVTIRSDTAELDDVFAYVTSRFSIVLAARGMTFVLEE